MNCLVPFPGSAGLFCLYLGMTHELGTLSARHKMALAWLCTLGFQGHCLRTGAKFHILWDLAAKRQTVPDTGPIHYHMLLGGIYLSPSGDLVVC